MSKITPRCQISTGKSDPGRINTRWNDEDVLPAVLSLDTEFVFRRMTEETLKAARTRNGRRILDVGCGRAIDAASLAQKGRNLFGCEPSQVMLRKAREWLEQKQVSVTLISGIAEAMPFADASFHRVVCKGAIDHFLDPEKAVVEMCRVASRQGKIVLSVANFESLSCILGRVVNRIYQRMRGREIPGPHIWKIPADHTYKFSYASTVALAKRHMHGIGVQGVSLLWGFPRWSNFLKAIPRPAALAVLKALDKIASIHPAWGDVLVLIGRPGNPFSPLERKGNDG